ncbi:helix-turn-helix domain-containing protein [Thalassotalea fusca]
MDKRQQQVAILAFKQVSLFELACAVELFALERPEISNWYHASVVTLDAQPIYASADITLHVRQVDSLSDYDVIIVPNWPADLTAPSEKLAAELVRAFKSDKRIISFCSGAFLLAQLGILNGKKTTTHWRYADKFQQYFPYVHYVDNVLYTYDGTIGCSAGSAAALDLGLEVIRQDYSQQVANNVARRLVISAQRKGGQNQFVETPVAPSNSHFSQAIDWALQNLSQSWSINDFAMQANMSRRTFDRKFNVSFNTSPKLWLIEQRIARAKSLLETNHGTVEQIADQCGFDSTSNFRHHFKRLLGISPSQYQTQFGCKK